jgi:hypothetical protein
MPPGTERGPARHRPPDQNPRSHKSYPQGNPSEQSWSVHELLDSLIGLEVDGGCDDCTAHQTIERVAAGVYVFHIFHDDTCPWWQRHQAATR